MAMPIGAQTTFTNGGVSGTVNKWPAAHHRFSNPSAAAGPIGNARIRAPVAAIAVM